MKPLLSIDHLLSVWHSQQPASLGIAGSISTLLFTRFRPSLHSRICGLSKYFYNIPRGKPKLGQFFSRADQQYNQLNRREAIRSCMQPWNQSITELVLKRVVLFPDLKVNQSCSDALAWQRSTTQRGKVLIQQNSLNLKKIG